MRVLLTGALDAYVPDMIPRLQHSGHSVSLLGEWTLSRDDVADVPCYRMDPCEEYAQRMVEIASYDVIVFFYSLGSEGIGEDNSKRGAMLDALWALATTAKRCGLKQFILVSDKRVFGSGQGGLEDEQPVPDTAAGVMNSAAEDCVTRCSQGDYASLILRVDSLYAPRWNGCLLSELMARDGREPYIMPYPSETPCGFLRAADLAAFICIAIRQRLSGAVHLTDSMLYDYGMVAERAVELKPSLRVSWSVKPSGAVALLSGRAETLGWSPEHRWDEELELLSCDNLADSDSLARQKRLSAAKKLGRAALVILPALPLYWLMMRRQGPIAIWVYFAWLIYAASAGVLNGLWAGATTAALACASYIAWLSRIGNGIRAGLSTFEGWLPLIVYALAGLLFGAFGSRIGKKARKARLLRERREEEIALRDIAQRKADEELERLEKESRDKSDSYGRIYSITRELNSLEPQQVLLSALDVIEDVLQSKRVAVYYLKPGDRYARLALSSRGMWLPRSLTVDEIEGLSEALKKGEAFSSAEGSPSLAVPIKRDGSSVAMIALWEKPERVMEPYYQNLFNITCGLVESAMARAMYRLRFATDVYLPHTHLLTERYFRSALDAYEKTRRLGRGDYLLLSVTSEDALGVVELDCRLGKVMRATDIAGRLSDGTVLALLPQADGEHYSRIAARFAERGMLCSPCDLPVDDEPCKQ